MGRDVLDVTQGSDKRKPKILKVILSIVGLLVLATVIFGIFTFITGDINGKWQSQNMEKQLEKEIAGEFSKETGEFDLSEKDIIGDTRIKMAVKRDKANVTIQVKINEDAFQKAFEDYLSKTINSYLSSQNLQYSDLTDEEKAIFEESIPSQKEIDAIIDQAFSQSVKIGGIYHKKTGIMTAPVFTGNVNRLSHHIKVTKANSKAIKISKVAAQKGDYTIYHKSGNKVTLEGHQKYTFHKE
ncbi:hypothetical protein HMPREF9318_01604 [Streptococcus urinalis FB127-CNA-2]|uniref:Uncharacterized protein n=2 Tax=Streptococcus urinalis TaxID=149016 RepID=G5KFA0_9STRE|nr:hypothetical protein [Streptococcus urinalis]EHJ56739.1 hypothetical protein STRUR_2244 [Streptococcus urinalis 2285-97]EKS19208.1 hypothetical protein HMPREF9318_01604 [Streptococcus urinalis FB127-CNA-2]VEF33070.1 Uncharacterised protein [Streptococcus urinalis]